MLEKKLSQNEKDILKVTKLGIDEAQAIPSLQGEMDAMDHNIQESENLLCSLGYDLQAIPKDSILSAPSAITVRPFSELLQEANRQYPDEIRFLDIFTPEEIAANHAHIRSLNEEFNAIHRLDSIDIIIPAVAGILSGVLDCAFGGFIRLENGKSIPGPFSDYVRKIFDKSLPKEKIRELEKMAKVTYDAANNKNTTVNVDGLSSYFHRLVSLGHDPCLGFIFGVLDMLRGTMTTLDFKGKFVVQAMDVYSDRKAQGLFEAISKVFLHMLSDVNTPAGLPVPFMAIFNKMQFGSIGEENLNISEMVKSMYGQGYDFRHFFSMSIPVMVTEVIVRVSYFAKRLSEGCSFMEAVPFGGDREKKPKLSTMLFIAHSTAATINAGKVALTKNPLNINYPQWMAFATLSCKQLKWVLHDKPTLRDKYVMSIINDEWDALCGDIGMLWRDTMRNANVMYQI